ncbi:uncharacterized protein METZ01_LOCUS179979, partial [marine metagenome]
VLIDYFTVDIEHCTARENLLVDRVNSALTYLLRDRLAGRDL